MHHILLFSGSALLIFSFIWAYVWLEVFRDLKGELQCFYVQNPVAYKAITALNKILFPALLLGATFVAVTLFIPEKNSV